MYKATAFYSMLKYGCWVNCGVDGNTDLCVQAVNGQIEVLASQVDDLKSRVNQAVRVWGLEELKRPHSHIRTQLSELQQSATFR